MSVEGWMRAQSPGFTKIGYVTACHAFDAERISHRSCPSPISVVTAGKAVLIRKKCQDIDFLAENEGQDDILRPPT